MSYERDALAAEGLLLREALEAYVFHCEIDGQRKSYCEGDYWCSRCSDGDACAVLTIPSLISAEVERVRLLEAVAEAAEEYRDAEQVQMLNEFKYDEPKYERQRRAKKTLDAALAELEAQE